MNPFNSTIIWHRGIMILQISGILLFFMTGCQQQSEPTLQTPAHLGDIVVAEVGGDRLYQSDIDTEIASLPEALHYTDDQKIRSHVQQTLLQSLVLRQRAEAEKLHHDPMIAHRIQRARDQILIAALSEWRMKSIPEPSKQQIVNYFNKNKEDYMIPEQIHARHILLSNREKAETMIDQLKKGADFASLAALHSLDDSNKMRGGNLNWFARGVMVKPFEEIAFSLKNTGDISPPVKSRYGWHVIELLGKKEALQKSVEDFHSEIIEQMQQAALDLWIGDQVKAAKIRVIK
ncbi:MAG: peptidylprolyl isomerase [Mariprofundaceae bacterium]